MPDTPDPEDVEALSSDETAFQRDEEGNLLPYWKVIEVGDEYRKVRFEATPIGEVEKFEQKFEGRDDIDVEELTELMNDKVVEPDVEWEEAKPRYYRAVMEALFSEMLGEDAVGMAEEVEAELAARQAEAAGN